MKKTIALFLALLMIIPLAAGCTSEPGSELSGNKTTTETVVHAPAKVTKGDAVESAAVNYNGGKYASVGNLDSSKCVLRLENGSFPEGSSVSVKPLDDDQLKTAVNSGRFEEIIAPVDLSVDGYDGSYFGEDVLFTVAIPEGVEEKDISLLAFCYCDSESGEMRICEPETVDPESGTMSVSLPHFSWWWGAKLTKEEQIGRFLDKYCMALALAKLGNAQLSFELEPYLEAKASALELTKEAAKDLVQSCISALGGTVSFDGENGDAATDLFGIDYNLIVSLTRAYIDGDAGTAKDALAGAVNSLMAFSWKQLKFSERATSVFKSEIASEFVPDGIDKLIENAGALGSLFGRIAGGDVEGAAKEVGSIMQGVHPAVDIGTKAVYLIANLANTGFTYWKSAQIEELYQVYKHGARGLFGNEVEPCDRESFLTFLNTSSGFTKAKGVARFYRLDKVGEICKRYGWSFGSYAEMPDRYREIFEKRAEDSLMEYFDNRVKQEAEADKIKEVEREVINTMLHTDFGALQSGYHGNFFKESSYKEYDLSRRLERIVKVRNFISRYVDADKLERSRRDGGFNMGDVVNWWVNLAGDHGKEEAIKLLIERLKEYGLLKEGMDKEIEAIKKAGVDQFFGDWVSSDYDNDRFRMIFKLYEGLAAPSMYFMDGGTDYNFTPDYKLIDGSLSFSEDFLYGGKISLTLIDADTIKMTGAAGNRTLIRKPS